MKFIYLTAILLLLSSSLSANAKFAKNKECKKCHPLISKEYASSMHFNSTIYRDPVHKAIWDKHPINKKKGKYKCAKCHIPTADNLSDMMGKGTKGMPDPDNETHNEAVACAFCHRIDSVEHGVMSHKNIVSKKEKHFYGNIKDALKNDFHTSSSTNENFKNGNMCIGCHSHKKNKAKLDVCVTDVSNKRDTNNCISCHMPKVKGSISSERKTKEHTFHGFPGASSNQDMLSKHIKLGFSKNDNGFEVMVDNQSPHALMLHPLRLTQLRVDIEIDGKIYRLKPKVFLRVIGKDGKPTPPWLATEVVKDTMIKGDEKRLVKYDQALKEGDKVHVMLGYFLVNPKALKKLGMENLESVKKFNVLKKETYIIK